MDTDAAHELLIYMVTSAAGLAEEAPYYGQLRLIESAERLCRLLLAKEPDNRLLRELIDMIETGKHTGMTDRDAFDRMLQGAAEKLVDLVS